MARPKSQQHDLKRDEILDIAAQCFASQSYPAASMNDIATAGGTSKARLYHYYESKEAILFDLLDRYTQRLLAIIAQAEATIIRAEKAAVGRSVLDMARQNPNPDFWTVDTPPTERAIDPRTGLVTTRVKPNYKALDNVFVVKEAGVEHFVTDHDTDAALPDLVIGLRSRRTCAAGRTPPCARRAWRWRLSTSRGHRPPGW